jgi:hypothetical protein
VPFAVVAMAWRGEHRAFVVEEYIRNGGSLITIQRAFRIRFELGRHDPVPGRRTGIVCKKNRQGPAKRKFCLFTVPDTPRNAR